MSATPPERPGPGDAHVHFTPGSRAAPTDPGAETRNCSNVKAGANFRSGAALPPRVCIGRRETVHGCTRQYLVGVLHAAITNDNLDPTGYASAAALTYQALHAHPSHSTIWLAGMTCACGVSVPSHWHWPAAGSGGAGPGRGAAPSVATVGGSAPARALKLLFPTLVQCELLSLSIQASS